VPIATMVSSLTATPTLFVRKQAKTYGTCRLAEGGEVAGRTITLIEDVITTGGAVRDAAAALRSQGATVNVVVCAINRALVDRPLADIDLEVRSVLTHRDFDDARRPDAR
jgi:orotate phosphoribosyltransferase